MNRIEKIRLLVDAELLRMKNAGERRCAYVHLYGVSQACALLACKRQLDTELAVIAGMLHDLYAYVAEPQNHAHCGAQMVRKLLEPLELFSPAELDRLCLAIFNHSDKAAVHNSLSELLKDADVLQHVLYDPTLTVRPAEQKRYAALQKELNMPTGTASDKP